MLRALQDGFPDDEYVVVDRGRFGALGADVAWLPAPRPVRVRGPYVLTVHDLSWEERPGDFTLYERGWHAAMRPHALARGAAGVVCPADVTRRALASRWGVDAVVVPQGVEPPGDGGGARRERPYVLFVGALEPRKAPELLLGAHARARGRGLDADLVFAGRGRLASRLAGRPGVEVLGDVGDAELDALYRGALCLVLPSWLEGYGLPPLEALARGPPPVLHDLPVYAETLGDGALRFPPGDAVALADALLRVGRERDRLLEAAPPLPRWSDAAARLHEVLEAAAR